MREGPENWRYLVFVVVLLIKLFLLGARRGAGRRSVRRNPRELVSLGPRPIPIPSLAQGMSFDAGQA